MDIQTKSKKIALLFFQPKMKLWIFCENITNVANSSLNGGGREVGSLITNSKKLFSFAPLLQSRLTSFSSPPPPPQKKTIVRREVGSLITNSKKLFSFAPLLQSRLTSFSSPPPPPPKKKKNHCPPSSVVKKDPIIIFLRFLQNYGVSGGGRLNKRRGC